MYRETYTVASNSDPDSASYITVLFSGESQTRPGHQIGPRLCDYYLMHHVISGKGIFMYRGKELELKAGDTFLIEPEELVRYEADQVNPSMYRWVAFQGKGVPEALEKTGFSSSRCIVHTRDNQNVSELFSTILSVLQDKKEGAHQKALGYLYVLFGELCEAIYPKTGIGMRTSSESGRTVQKAIHYLSTQYAEDISIETMADNLGYNRAYLSRIFKQETGLTPVTFLLKLRIDKARFLLRQRMELTIEQIASSVGFHDPLYFSKQFKRFYKCAPTEYRDSIKHIRKEN